MIERKGYIPSGVTCAAHDLIDHTSEAVLNRDYSNSSYYHVFYADRAVRGHRGEIIVESSSLKHVSDCPFRISECLKDI
jgi:hypothetical protein